MHNNKCHCKKSLHLVRRHTSAFVYLTRMCGKTFYFLCQHKRKQRKNVCFLGKKKFKADVNTLFFLIGTKNNNE